jgi:hypothetical protein
VRWFDLISFALVWRSTRRTSSGLRRPGAEIAKLPVDKIEPP